MKIYSEILFFPPLQDDDTSEQQGKELVNAGRGAYDTTGTPKPQPPKPRRVASFDPFVYC